MAKGTVSGAEPGFLHGTEGSGDTQMDTLSEPCRWPPEREEQRATGSVPLLWACSGDSS